MLKCFRGFVFMSDWAVLACFGVIGGCCFLLHFAGFGVWVVLFRVLLGYVGRLGCAWLGLYIWLRHGGFLPFWYLMFHAWGVSLRWLSLAWSVPSYSLWGFYSLDGVVWCENVAAVVCPSVLRAYVVGLWQSELGNEVVLRFSCPYVGACVSLRFYLYMWLVRCISRLFSTYDGSSLPSGCCIASGIS